MPTYEYRCKQCQHEFELFQSMSAPVKRKCPKCNQNALERLIGTGSAVIFKGSGFYQTDYRSESYKKAAKADKPDSGAAKDSSKSGNTSENTKPDKKPDSTSKKKSNTGKAD